MGKKKEHKIISIPNCKDCKDLIKCLPLGGDPNYIPNCIFIEVEI